MQSVYDLRLCQDSQATGADITTPCVLLSSVNKPPFPTSTHSFSHQGRSRSAPDQ